MACLTAFDLHNDIKKCLNNISRKDNTSRSMNPKYASVPNLIHWVTTHPMRMYNPYIYYRGNWAKKTDLGPC